MQLTTRARIQVPRPPDQVFDFAVSTESFPRMMQPLGPIPGIVSMEMQGGARPARGARRRVTMTDGSVINEELLAYERPTRHQYRWLDPPKFPFSLLVKRGEGDFRFAPAEGGTRIEWTYRFQLTTPLVVGMTLPVLFLFRRWMKQGLTRIRDELR